MLRNGDEIVFVRVGDYYIAVCGSDKEAAEVILEENEMEDDYTVNYVLDTMGLGYTEYEATKRPLVGDQEEDGIVFVAYDGTGDGGDKTDACGSYEAAYGNLKERVGTDEWELDAMLDGGSVEIMRVELGVVDTDVFELDYYDVTDK